MVVLKEHTIYPSDYELGHMMGALVAVAEGLLGLRGRIDFLRRSIPDHWHCHYRI
jgi:hypothetical protein